MPLSQTPKPGTLLYVVTEDWFFRSHFLPMARRARDDGWRVVIAARLGPAAEDLAAEGFETVALGATRGGGPLALAAMVLRLRALIRQLKPAIVHLISLKPVVVGGLALTGNRDVATVLAVTGLGFLGTARSVGARLGLRLARSYLRRLGRRPRTVALLENTSDRAWLWPEGTDRLPVAPVILPGAGVDPDRFEARPEPTAPPVKIGLVARMLWSKGIDVAVAAVETLRSRGVAVELDLYGAPDDDNPRAFSRAQLAAFSAREGIAWHGPTADVAAVWAGTHICLLPSRGGEGLPRSLLEAAACGRPIVTTAVPGCRDFVRDGIDGLVVAVDDPAALADALGKLAADGALRRRMGDSARERVLSGYTEDHVAGLVAQAYRSVV